VSQATQAFAAHNDTAAKVMLSERPDALALRHILQSEPTRKRAVLAIGPEGGWTEAEFIAAQAAGFREASLGKLILRTETAVVAALASINYALSE
jgi:16S rRNA (uracil1498-N3)-methyltransferase